MHCNPLHCKEKQRNARQHNETKCNAPLSSIAHQQDQTAKHHKAK
jgi:hypothetical protein